MLYYQSTPFMELADLNQSRTGKNIVQGFTKSQKPILYFFPNRNTTPVDHRRPVHAVGDVFRGRTQVAHSLIMFFYP